MLFVIMRARVNESQGSHYEEKKTVRDIGETFRLTKKSTAWNNVKKKERTDELGIRKGLGRPRKTPIVDD